VCGFFFVIVLHPLFGFLQASQFPFVIATFIRMLTTSLILGFGTFYIISQGKVLFMNTLDLVEQFNSLFNNFGKLVTGTLQVSVKALLQLVKANANQLVKSGNGVYRDAVAAISEFITFFTSIPNYVLFVPTSLSIFMPSKLIFNLKYT
jgi:predicted PurR-regulated permease PerM